VQEKKRDIDSKNQRVKRKFLLHTHACVSSTAQQ
jgi:hypothetical protein